MLFSGVTFAAILRGSRGVLRSSMGLPPQQHEDGTSSEVHSIDLMIVGLGLIIVLLVLLRR